MSTSTSTSLFEIDYLKKTWKLMQEAFKFKKYKAMHPAFAVFVGIFMLPFVVVSIALTAVLTVLCFVYSLLLTPVKHFHSIVHAEGQTVKAGAQFWIYFFTWIILFAFYLVFSFIPVVIYLLYILLVIFSYIFSLGGFKFHIYPNADSDDIAKENDLSKGRFLVVPILFISIIGVLLIVAGVFGILFAATFEFIFLLLTIIMAGVYALTAALFAFIGFGPRYVKKADAVQAEVAAAPKAEPVKKAPAKAAAPKAEPAKKAPAKAAAPKAEPVKKAPVKVEAPVEEVVEAPVEEMVEEIAEEVAEEVAEEIAEEVVEEIAEEAVEEVAEEVEEAVEEAAEETVEEAAEEAIEE